MSEAWPRVALGEATESLDSKRIPVRAQDRRPGPYPYWGASGVVDHVEGFIFDQPALLVAEDGENLKTRKTPIAFIARGRYWVNNHAHVLVAKPNFDLNYLGYAVEESDVSGYLTGSTQPKLTAGSLKRLRIPAPCLEEQRRIAGVLGALDDLAAVELDVATRCGKLWRALVARAIAGRSSQEMPLSSLARFVNGRNYTKNASGTGRPVVRTPEVRNGPNPNTVFNDIDATDDHLAQSGDILFVWSGSLCVNRWAYQEGLVNQHVFKVLPADGVPDWLVFYSVEQQMKWFLSLAADKATTMGHIQRRHLDAGVRIPSDLEIEELEPLVRPLWDQELASRIDAEAATATRDELLPLLLSGRVRVGEVAA